VEEVEAASVDLVEEVLVELEQVVIGKFIKEHSVQTFSLNTPRGLTVFQKKSVHMSYVKYINNEL
jgi:hypothetical protein